MLGGGADGQMDRWSGGAVRWGEELLEGWGGGGRERRREEEKDGGRGGWMDRQMERWTEGRKDGKEQGWMEGKMGGRREKVEKDEDGQMDG